MGSKAEGGERRAEGRGAELCWGGSPGWVCPEERGSPVRVPTMGLSPHWLRRPSGGTTRRAVSDPSFPSQVPLKGTRRLRRAQQMTRYPSPSPCTPKPRAEPVGFPSGILIDCKPRCVRPEQEAAARGVPAISLFRGTLSLQSSGEGRPGLPVSSQPCPGSFPRLLGFGLMWFRGFVQDFPVPEPLGASCVLHQIRGWRS